MLDRNCLGPWLRHGCGLCSGDSERTCEKDWVTVFNTILALGDKAAVLVMENSLKRLLEHLQGQALRRRGKQTQQNWEAALALPPWRLNGVIIANASEETRKGLDIPLGRSTLVGRHKRSLLPTKFSWRHLDRPREFTLLRNRGKF